MKFDIDYRRLFTENGGLKLVSLILAVSLWFFVTSKGKVEVSMTVPIELQNIPAGMTVVGDVLRYLEVRLQAQERILRDITAGKKVVCVLNLGMTRTGENILRISPDDIRRPSGVSVTHLSPYEIRVRLEPLIKKTLRLAPVLHGAAAAGYRVVEAVPSPPRVTAEGPASVMRQLSVLRTMPLDVQGATGTLTLEPRIDTEGKPVTLLEKNVTVTVTVRKAN